MFALVRAHARREWRAIPRAASARAASSALSSVPSSKKKLFLAEKIVAARLGDLARGCMRVSSTCVHILSKTAIQPNERKPSSPSFLDKA